MHTSLLDWARKSGVRRASAAFCHTPRGVNVPFHHFPATFSPPRAMNSTSARMLAALATLALAGCGDAPFVPEKPAVCAESPRPAGQPSATPLFALVAAPALTAAQEELVGYIRARPASAEVHLGRLADDAAALLRAKQPLEIPVSPTRGFVAVPTEVIPRSDGLSWSAGLAAEQGNVFLVVTPAGIAGSVGTALHQSYTLESIGGGLVAVVCTDRSKFLPD